MPGEKHSIVFPLLSAGSRSAVLPALATKQAAARRHDRRLLIFCINAAAEPNNAKPKAIG